jgi:hypothetical protein
MVWDEGLQEVKRRLRRCRYSLYMFICWCIAVVHLEIGTYIYQLAANCCRANIFSFLVHLQGILRFDLSDDDSQVLFWNVVEKICQQPMCWWSVINK